MKRLMTFGFLGLFVLALPLTLWADDDCERGNNPIAVSGGDSATAVYNSSFINCTEVTVSDGEATVTTAPITTIFSDSSDAIHTSGGGYDIYINGYVASEGFNAVNAEGDGNSIYHNSLRTIAVFAGDGVAGAAIVTDDDAFIENWGRIFSEGDGIVFGSDSEVINYSIIEAYGSGLIGDDWNDIYNYGTILADQVDNPDPNTGISVDDFNYIYNDGYIESQTSNGIVADDYNDIENQGTIRANKSGIVVGNDNWVYNNGSIYADFVFFSKDASGITAGDDNEIINEGEIFSDTSNGISAGNGNTITNDGSIDAELAGINVGNDNEVTNTGRIGGSAPLAVQADPTNGIVAGDGNIIYNGTEEDYESAIIHTWESGIIAGSDNEIYNYGMIDADHDYEGMVMMAQETGIHVEDENLIENWGTIHSHSSNGISANDGNEIYNYGDIQTAAMDYMSGTGIKVNDGNEVVNYASPCFFGDSDDDCEYEGGIGSQVGIAGGDDNTITNNGYIGSYPLEGMPVGEAMFIGMPSLVGIVVQQDMDALFDDMMNSEGPEDALLSLFEVMAQDVDENLLGNDITNNGEIDSMIGIIGVGNNTIDNNGAIYGSVMGGDSDDDVSAVGILALQGNEINNNQGATIDAAVGILVRNDNQVTNYAGEENDNAGYIYGFLAGIVAGTGNTIENAPQGDIYADMIGILAADDNTIDNYGTIVAGEFGPFGVGIATTDQPVLNLLADLANEMSEGELALSYMPDYVRVGNEIDNMGSIYALNFGAFLQAGTYMLENEISDVHDLLQVEVDPELAGDTLMNNFSGEIYAPVGIFGAVNNEITNRGVISGLGDDDDQAHVGIVVLDGNTVTNAFTGTINADTAIMARNNNTVTNWGDIDTQSSGPDIYGNIGNTITNEQSGSINNSEYGIMVFDDNTVVNKGEIQNHYAGIVASGEYAYSDGEAAVSYFATVDDIIAYLANYQGNRITNSGSIYNSMIGILINNGEEWEVIYENVMTAVDEGEFVIGTDYLNEITNDGTIGALSSDICEFDECYDTDYGIVAGYFSKVTNNGNIFAQNDGITGMDGNIILNTGDIFANGEPSTTSGIHVRSNNIVTNEGLIFTSWNGQFGTAGIAVDGFGNTITNDVGGTLQTGGYGIAANNRREIFARIGDFGDDDVEIVNNTIINNGDIIKTEDEGDFGFAGIYAMNNADITNGEKGVIERFNGIYLGREGTVTNEGEINADRIGIRVGTATEVRNSGDITTDGAYALNVRTPSAGISAEAQFIYRTKRMEDDTSFENLIINEKGGVITANWNDQADVAGIFAPWWNDIENHGEIHSDMDGILVYDYNRITNTGLIHSDKIDFVGGFEPPPPCAIDAGNNNVINNDGGTIISDYSLGISAGSNNSITNSGEITALMAGIYVRDNSDPEEEGLWICPEDDDDDCVYDTTKVNVITNTSEGSITGAIGIEMLGPGIISTAGTITSTDGPAILLDYWPGQNDQFITLQSGAVVNGDIVDDCFECDEDVLTFNGSGSFSDDVYGIEYIYKTGEGTWILEGSGSEGPDDDGGSYVEAYNVAIMAGTLQVDGDISYTGEFTIFDGATLAGNADLYYGFARGTVHNDGTIAPGPVDCSGLECIGEIYIDDDFNNYREGYGAGNLAIDLWGEEVDYIDINGEAQFGLLGDDDDDIGLGTVTVAVKGVLTNLDDEDGRDYEFLYADGDLGFDYDDVLYGDQDEAVAAMLVDNIALYDFLLWEDGNYMYLDVEEVTPAEAGGSANDQSFFDALREEADGGNNDAQDLLDQLAGMSLEELTEALGQLAPEQYPNLLDMSRGGFGIYRNAITGRMGNLHLTRATQETNQYVSSTVYEEGPNQSRIPAFENQAMGWSSWGRIIGMTGEQDPDNGIQGYDFDTYGVSFGFDNKVNDTCAFGLGFGLTNSDVSFNGGQNTDMDSYHVGLYGTHSNERYYLDAAILYAANEYDSTRTNAQSSTDGTEWGLYVGGGYTLMETDSMYFMPTASIEYAAVEIDGFTETGTNPFLYDVDSYDTDSFVTTLGFRLGGKLATGETRFEPELRLAWAHEFGDTDRQIRARFVGSTTTFALEGVEPNENSILVGVGANFFVKENTTLYVDYDGEFRDGFGGHALSAGFRYNF